MGRNMVKPEQADCLGHYGIAREAATLYRLPLKPVQPKFTESAAPVSQATSVVIESPELCARFTARVFRGVKVQPSPDWLRQRLEALGHASINNVVDITNYVMLELGQPLHAFDLDKLAEHRLIVRRARAGEKLRTLDGIERTLPAGTCVVADPSRGDLDCRNYGRRGYRNRLCDAQCVSRIRMVGSDFDSPHVEGAEFAHRGFDALRARRRYRNGGACFAPRCGIDAATRAAAKCSSGVVDVYPGKEPPRKLELTRKEFLRVMGADIPDRDIEDILGALGFAPVRVDANRGSAGSLAAAWECRQPSWRRDVTREIDLIEEVARIYGYDKFPPRIPPSKQRRSAPAPRAG